MLLLLLLLLFQYFLISFSHHLLLVQAHGVIISNSEFGSASFIVQFYLCDPQHCLYAIGNATFLTYTSTDNLFLIGNMFGRIFPEISSESEFFRNSDQKVRLSFSMMFVLGLYGRKLTSKLRNGVIKNFAMLKRRKGEYWWFMNKTYMYYTMYCVLCAI